MLSTSAVYFVITYQQFTDESGDGIQEFPGEKKTSEGTNDMDSSQWMELDSGGKVQTIFFLIIATMYIPIGIWMLKKEHSNKPHMIAFGGSLSLILFYIISRNMILPVVGIQTDIGTIDIITKVLQTIIAAGSFSLIITRRKLEKSMRNDKSEFSYKF